MSYQHLYFHFPFCETKCHYCDFYSLAASKTTHEQHQSFENALDQEIKLRQNAVLGPLKTVFFGGGTPSMTATEAMTSLFKDWLVPRLEKPHYEWTVEANPSSVNFNKLSLYKNLGVNRVSFGVQSLIPEQLQLLGRVHSREEASEALEAAFVAGFSNISVDVLCGIPNQTLAQLETTLEGLLRFPITHLSCYLLTLAPHHAMYKLLPNEETQLSHLLFLHEWMTDHGFEHYEISNFARPRFRAEHNLAYWKRRPYLGFGPSAHSFDGTRRWKNLSSLKGYVTALSDGRLPIEQEETLTSSQQELEKWMLQLRLSDGFSKAELHHPWQKKKVDGLLEEGWLEDHPTRFNFLRCSPKGFTLVDRLSLELSA